jgi:hypothetical protein
MQDNFEEHIKEKLLGNSLTPNENVWNQIEHELRKKDGFEIKLKHKTDELVLGNLNPNVWQQIEAQLNKKRRRRVLLWLVLAIGTASASILALSKFEAAEKDVIVEQKTKPIQKTKLEFKQSIAHNSINSVNKTQEKSEHSKIKSTIEIEELAPVKFEKKAKRITQSKTEKSEIQSPVLEVLENAIVKSENIVTAENKVQQNTVTTALSTSVKKESNTIELVKEIKIPEIKNNVVKTDSVAEKLNFKANTYRKQNEKEFGNWAIIIGLGFNYTGMQLLANNQTNLTQRKGIESPSIDWSTNLLVNRQVTKKWSMSTGLGITHFKQNLNFNKTPAKGSIVHPLNANSYIYGSDSIGIGSQNALENRYTFLELPFNLNYQFKQSNQWSWQLQLGYSLGILYHVDAYHLDPNNIGLVIVNSTDNFPNFNAAHFVSIAPKMEYQLQRGLDIGVQLKGKTSLNSIIQEQSWIEQKPYLIGLEISLKKRF